MPHLFQNRTSLAHTGGRDPKLQHGGVGARGGGAGRGPGPGHGSRPTGAWGWGAEAASHLGPRREEGGTPGPAACSAGWLASGTPRGDRDRGPTGPPAPCLVTGRHRARPCGEGSAGSCLHPGGASSSSSPPGQEFCQNPGRGKRSNGELLPEGTRDWPPPKHGCPRPQPPPSSVSSPSYKGANGMERRPRPRHTQGTAWGRAVGPRLGRAVQIKVGCECVTAKRGPAGARGCVGEDACLPARSCVGCPREALN